MKSVHSRLVVKPILNTKLWRTKTYLSYIKDVRDVNSVIIEGTRETFDANIDKRGLDVGGRDRARSSTPFAKMFICFNSLKL